MTEPATTDHPPPPPPPPPRAVPPHVRARLWREPPVRFWWGLAIALAIIGLYLATVQTWQWNQERRLIEHGVPVKALVRVANGVPDRGKSQPPDSVVELTYTHEGKEYEAEDRLAGREEWIVVGSEIDLRLDPADPSVWTARLEPTPLARQLVGASLTIPAIVVALLIAAMMHRRMARVYENGQLVPADVVELRTSPIAPMSRQVVCTPADPDDKRLFTVYIPQKFIALQPGDDVNLLIHGNRALAVMKYE